MFQLIIKDSLDQLVLSWNNSHNIVSVFIFLISGDVFSFLDVQVSGDFGQEDCEGHHKDTPSVVDDVPNTGSVFLDSNKLWTQRDRNSLEHGLGGQHKLIQRPIELHALITIGII